MKWKATIKPPNESRRKHIGFFVKEEDAARAYDEKAIIFFGEFAKLNFPQESLILCDPATPYHVKLNGLLK